MPTNTPTNKFYVTTPIYYVNAKPHIGHLYSTLLADVITRWNKLKGKETFFLTGLDEHGQKVHQAAKEAGMHPQQFVDQMVPKFTKVWERYRIEYDKFIRTTDNEHKKAVTKLIQKLINKGKIYKSTYSGFYCTPCETFVTPQEKKKNKKGEKEVLCPSCQRKTKEISEESYFFRLSEYQQDLLKFYTENPNFIQPKSRLNEVISFVKSGLKDLSFSRQSVSWGIPFPEDPTHTVYVWGDALTNYISAVGYSNNQEIFNKWWPADLHILAKDILRFHAVYWPAMLMAADLPLPRRELVHGYVIMDEKKMSKSIGNVVDPQMLADLYGTDQVRYYLARTIPTTQDGSFSLGELEECIKSDLANNLGNLLSRCVTLAIKNNLKTVSLKQSLDSLDTDCKNLIETLNAQLVVIKNNMDQQLIHIAVSEICKLLSEANALFHKTQPWKLAKENSERFNLVTWCVLKILYACGHLLWPVMPTKMEGLMAVIGHTIKLDTSVIDKLSCNEVTFLLNPLSESLFPKPEESSKKYLTNQDKTVKQDQQSENEFINIEDFFKVKMVIGKIIKAEKLEKSKKLLKLEVDLGPHGIRQVVSGIAEYYTPEEVLGKSAAFVINLKPRKIMGIESQAMIMCTKDSDGLCILSPSKKTDPGSPVS